MRRPHSPSGPALGTSPAARALVGRPGRSHTRALTRVGSEPRLFQQLKEERLTNG